MLIERSYRSLPQLSCIIESRTIYHILSRCSNFFQTRVFFMSILGGTRYHVPFKYKCLNMAVFEYGLSTPAFVRGVMLPSILSLM